MVCWGPDCIPMKPGERVTGPGDTAGMSCSVPGSGSGQWWGTRVMGYGGWVEHCTPPVVRVRDLHFLVLPCFTAFSAFSGNSLHFWYFPEILYISGIFRKFHCFTGNSTVLPGFLRFATVGLSRATAGSSEDTAGSSGVTVVVSQWCH